MAIKEITGNIIGLGETGVIDGWAHGCNCLHAMGSGVAGQVARRYPLVPRIDQTWSTYGDFTKIGTYTMATCPSIVDPGIWFTVFNLYTQKTPSYDGEDVFEYGGFHKALQTLVGTLTRDRPAGRNYRLGFPKIGAGLAGGDWPRIERIIRAVFEDVDVDVLLVEWDGTNLD